MAQEVLALVGQADGRDVRHVLYRPVQPEHGHVETVGLRRELEERMHADLAHAERVRRQRFHRRVDHVIAQRHLHLARRRSAPTKHDNARLTTLGRTTLAPVPPVVHSSVAGTGRLKTPRFIPVLHARRLRLGRLTCRIGRLSEKFRRHNGHPG